MSGWLGLRSLRVPPLPSALAVGSLCAAPMATSFQLNGPNTDFPALVWLVVAGGLWPPASAADPRSPYLDAPLVGLFVDGPAADGRPIYSVPQAIPMLAGNDLARKVEAIPRKEPCAGIEARARAGWVVLIRATGDELLGPSTIKGCVSTWRPFYEDASVQVFNGASGLAA